jgi:hypothetical protein
MMEGIVLPEEDVDDAVNAPASWFGRQDALKRSVCDVSEK